MILAFRDISKKASYLLYPYFVWVTFAGYLNLGIALLFRGQLVIKEPMV